MAMNALRQQRFATPNIDSKPFPIWANALCYPCFMPVRQRNSGVHAGYLRLKLHGFHSGLNQSYRHFQSPLLHCQVWSAGGLWIRPYNLSPSNFVQSIFFCFLISNSWISLAASSTVTSTAFPLCFKALTNQFCLVFFTTYFPIAEAAFPAVPHSLVLHFHGRNEEILIFAFPIFFFFYFLILNNWLSPVLQGFTALRSQFCSVVFFYLPVPKSWKNFTAISTVTSTAFPRSEWGAYGPGLAFSAQLIFVLLSNSQ